MAFHQVGSFFQMYRMLGWKCGRKTAGKIFRKMNNRRYLRCPVPFLSNWMRTGKGRKKEREKRKERVGPGNRGRLKEGFKLPASLWGGGLFPVSLLWKSQFWSVAIFFFFFRIYFLWFLWFYQCKLLQCYANQWSCADLHDKKITPSYLALRLK